MTIRPSVADFAELMESVLKENDWKDGWQDMDLCDCLFRLSGEAAELREAVGRFELNHRHTAEELNRLRKEAADVANFAMFIVEIAGRYGRNSAEVPHDPA